MRADLSDMKNSLLLGLVVAFGTTLAVCAAESHGKPLTAEQKQQRDAVIQKYDANKDGVLDKSELKGVSKAGKKVLAKTGGVPTTKGEAKAEASEKTEKAEKELKGKKQEKSSEAESKAESKKAKGKK